MNDLHIVTVVTDSKYYFPYLVESCKKYGKELTILGYGKKWLGFAWKYKLMIDYLKNLPKTDIVCFIDAYDVICLRDLSELKKEFIKIRNSTNCKIIVGHDKIDTSTLYYTANYYFNYYYFGLCDNVFLNSGTYIGYVYDLLDILTKVYNETIENIDDDQILLIDYCKKNKKEIYIDVDNKLFLTINKKSSEIDDLVEIKNNKLIYNNNEPFFIHGPGKTSLTNILSKLDYKLYELEKHNNIPDANLKSIYKILFKGNYTKICIILLIIVIFIIIQIR